MDDDTPDSRCPRCRAWVPDLDGFGVLYYRACGHCAHASCSTDRADVMRIDERRVVVTEHDGEPD